jgi:hypothetical protein
VVHLSVLVHGYEHTKVGIVETLLGTVLVLGLVGIRPESTFTFIILI